ncbi:hypothetical protein OIE43_35540 [Streptomyces pseudovenezuelae]|uniref:SCP2 domain-containing protein n=1 Tax=Streptomyces pseudovenezuelae TaxID=67350 RepID=A0ABZ1WR41_9ACTN|nr:hypothetical protein [Streptomyces pseudovenezuelae]
MIDTTEADGAFQNRCANAARALAPCVGHVVHRIAFDAFPEADSLEITLRAGPHRSDVVISLGGVRYVSVAKDSDVEGFVDEISLMHLPRTPWPWPAETAAMVGRFGGLPELAWLRIVGPVEVDVVASIVTVYSAMSDDEASVDRSA